MKKHISKVLTMIMAAILIAGACITPAFSVSAAGTDSVTPTFRYVRWATKVNGTTYNKLEESFILNSSNPSVYGGLAVCFDEGDPAYNGTASYAYQGPIQNFSPRNTTVDNTWVYRCLLAADNIIYTEPYVSSLPIEARSLAIQNAIRRPNGFRYNGVTNHTGTEYTGTTSGNPIILSAAQSTQMVNLVNAIVDAAKLRTDTLPSLTNDTFTLNVTKSGGGYISGDNLILGTYNISVTGATAAVNPGSTTGVVCSVSGNTLTVYIPLNVITGPIYYSVTVSKNTQRTVWAPAIYKYSDTYQRLVALNSYTLGSSGSKTVNDTIYDTGRIKIYKTDENGSTPLSGAKFSVYNTETESTLVTEETDENGYVEIEVSHGKYRVTEVKFPSNYESSGTEYWDVEITPNTPEVTLNITNKHSVGKIEINKTDSETGAKIPGVQFGVYREELCENLVETITTDNNGHAISSELPVATYYIKEISAPSNYIASAAVTAANITTGVTITFNFTNEHKKGYISITKKDTETGALLPGAVYGIYSDAGCLNLIQTMTTSQFGFAISNQLRVGTYYVKEITAPTNYILKTDVTSVNISWNNETKTLFTNEYKKGNIKINKTDSVYGEAIGGALFGVYKNEECTNYVGQISIGADGIGYYNNLRIGQYYVREITAPNGYVLSDAVYPVEVMWDNTVSVDVQNDAQKAKISLYKKGEMFTGYNTENTLFGTKYIPVYEEKYLEGAVFNIYADEDITVNGHVVHTANELIETVTSSANGPVFTSELYLGNYRIEEIAAPNGYYLGTNTSFDVVLDYKGQNTNTYVFDFEATNIRQKMVLNFNKIFENTSIFDVSDAHQNTAFGIFVDEDIQDSNGNKLLKDSLVDIINVAENGSCVSNADLPFGKYYVKELKTDIRYKIDNNKYPFEFTYAEQTTATVTVTINQGENISNTLKRGSISGTKSDEYGNRIAGITIGLFVKPDTAKEHGWYLENIANAIATATTNEFGEYVFNNVLYGEWIIVELSAPEKYVLDNTVYNVTVTEDGQTNTGLDFVNRIVKSTIHITKTDIETGETLAGVEYTVYDVNGNPVTTITTDENGKASVVLNYGTYTLKETKAKTGYVANDTVSNISVTTDGEEIKYSFTNRIIKSTVIVTKTDVETGETLAGVEYTVYDVNGNPVTTITTDENGKASVVLNYGTYTLKETKAKAGYVANDSITNINVVNDGEEINYSFTNRIIKSTVNITKTDAETGLALAGVEYTVYDVNGNPVTTITTDENGKASVVLNYGTYTLKETKAKIGYVANDTVSNISVTTDGEVISFAYTNRIIKSTVKVTKTDVETGATLAGVEYTVYDELGNAVTTITTDANGEASVVLNYGNYTIKETKAKVGYVANDTVSNISVTTDGEIISFDFTNRIIKSTVNVTKTDVETGLALAGVEYTVYDVNGNPVTTITTDENGKASVVLSYGTYTLKETKAKAGYVANDSITNINVINDGEVIDYSFTNRIIKSTVKVTKADVETREILAGVEYTVYDVNGNPVTTITTDANGEASVVLNYGTYTLKETKAKTGYVANDTVSNISVTTDGEIISFDFTNRIIKSTVIVTKTDVETGETLAGVEYTVYDVNGSPVTTITTDENGKASVVLNYGDYTVRETRAKVGYVPSQNTYYIGIVNDAAIIEMHLTNRKIYGKISGRKVDDEGNMIKGAIIGLFGYPEGVSEITNDIFTEENAIVIVETDDKGEFTFEKIPYGSWVVKELHSPDGYVLAAQIDTRDIMNDGDEFSDIEILNRIIRSTLTLSKVDFETGEPLEGAEFTVYDLEHNVIATMTTDKNGTASVVLKYGSYIIDETKTPDGYMYDDTHYMFESVNDGENIEFTISNHKLESKSPETGDTNNYVLIFILLALSCLCLIAATKIRKINNN